MIWTLLAFHAIVVAGVAAIGDRLGPRAFLVASVAPAAATVWGLGRLGTDPATAELTWVDGLDLRLAFVVGPLATAMTLVVSGIGVAVLVYAHGYFGSTAEGVGRMAATLLAFSTAMLGLVWADSVWTLFVFWELTSVTSFLLVGHKNTDPAARTAARRALVITAAGGLVLLGGLLVLVDATGTDRLGAMGPAGGGSAAVAAIAVLVAAATKSAQVPFHVWLPGAMTAPTPVSAYLHSATMVKAGVLLVALTAPVLSGADVWKPLGLSLGLASTVWGAAAALRHVDAKLVLAWGTISQLGLMVALLSIGTAKATFAAVALVLAHALFKAALFMVVGEIDVRTGTRDLRELSGLWRTMPVACGVSVVAGLSMAGAPPVLGFAAKEAVVEAVLGRSGLEAVVLGIAVFGGSVLTVAYTVRLLVGLFADAGPPTPVAPARPSLTVAAVALAVASVAGYVALGQVSTLVRDAAAQIDPGATAYDLLRWPGLTQAFVVSMAIVGSGAIVGIAAHRHRGGVPRAIGAGIVDRGVDEVPHLARRVAARVQHGSLPVYLATMALTLAVAALPFAWGLDTGGLRRWDNGYQAVLVVLTLGAALAGALVGSRLGAALALGAVGIAVTGIFVVHGAPDLVLTQLLVETVIVVGFVIGLGHLRRRFPATGGSWLGVRLAVAGAAGATVAIALISASGSPTGRPPVDALAVAAVEEGGGNNIVNVVLTDIRALDTLGEIFVLATVAVGILALARSGRSSSDGSGVAR